VRAALFFAWSPRFAADAAIPAVTDVAAIVGFHSIDLQASLLLLAAQMLLMSLVSLVLLLVILLLLAPSFLYPSFPTFFPFCRLASLLLLLQDFSISEFKAYSGNTYV
jgi:hypothetical protein